MARNTKPDHQKAQLKAAKARLALLGYSVPRFARELGVHPTIVRRVLSGKFKGLWGDSHKVAVALGLKKGVIVGPGESVADALRRADVAEAAHPEKMAS